MKNQIIVILGWMALSLPLVAVADPVDISIPCLDQSNKVKNANESEVCKGMLPKCVDLKKQMIDNMKDKISWKIYGYYHLGKDIDLTTYQGGDGKIDPSKIDGVPLPYPVCSVVGRSLKANEPGDVPNRKLDGKSCGEYPRLKNYGLGSYRFDLEYQGQTNWASFALGAYPWELRRNAYDVSSELDDDLSKLGKVISNLDQQQDILKTVQGFKAQTQKLNAASKAACSQPTETSTILEGCSSKDPKKQLSISSPLQSLCTLSKAQLAMNAVAIPNVLVFEVMKRTEQMHQQHFSKVFVGQGDTGVNELAKFCGRNKSLLGQVGNILNLVTFGTVRLIKANKTYSCAASCLTDGQEWYTNAGFSSSYSWKNSGGAKQRKCRKESRYDLNSGQPYQSLMSSIIGPESFLAWIADVLDLITGGSWSEKSTDETPVNEQALSNNNATNNVGIAGLIESKIRRDVCQQKGSKTADNKCDQIDIPDQPKLVTNGG